VVLDYLSYDYTEDKAVLTQVSGCAVRSWKGRDPYGVVDRPWLAFVSCDQDSSFTQAGVNQHGSVKFVLVEGWLTVGGITISTMGEAVWLQMGVETRVEISGSCYIVGAKFELVISKSAQIMSTYMAPTIRGYFVEDAFVTHNPGLNNGTAEANSVEWGSNTTVDPAHVTIVACEDVGLAFHVHPQGVVYLPLSGLLCFETETSEQCAPVGEARWNSPLLWYRESFYMSSNASAAAQNLAKLSGLDCSTPIALSVTNFDSFNRAASPSFTDEPDLDGELLIRMTTVKSFVLVAPQTKEQVHEQEIRKDLP
jgi:hypothetical protein